MRISYNGAETTIPWKTEYGNHREVRIGITEHKLQAANMKRLQRAMEDQITELTKVRKAIASEARIKYKENWES